MMRSTDATASFLFVTAAFVLIAVCQAITLYYHVSGLGLQPANLFEELLTLVVSLLMLGAVILFRPIYLSLINTEKNLRESEAIYRGILENMDDSYFRMDNKLRLVMASPSLVDLLDYPLDELIGMSFYDFSIDVSERDRMLEILKVKGNVKSYPFKIKRGDEVEFPAELSAHFVFDLAGEIQGIEGVVRNISERLRSEESALRFTQIFEDSLN
ncbi:MAG: PAS domain S-box protein, partial [Pseudomonadales bacterium]|nr:PAS domain S-box protein [Pseudomonadales bacterium]